MNFSLTLSHDQISATKDTYEDKARGSIVGAYWVLGETKNIKNKITVAKQKTKNNKN